MARSQGGEGKLQEQFQHLQEDWNSYKQSTTRHRRSRSIADLTTTTTTTLEFLKLLHNSPKKLLSSLQRNRSPTEEWKSRSSDRAIEEIVTERRAAIKSGKLRGRRLFEALEGARDQEVSLLGKEEICSVCSSILIQSSAQTISSCSCSLSSSATCNGLCGGYCSSSSSYSMEGVGREVLGVKRDHDGGDGGKWMVRMGWFSIALMVSALGIISLMGFGLEVDGEYITPT